MEFVALYRGDEEEVALMNLSNHKKVTVSLESIDKMEERGVRFINKCTLDYEWQEASQYILIGLNSDYGVVCNMDGMTVKLDIDIIQLLAKNGKINNAFFKEGTIVWEGEQVKVENVGITSGKGDIVGIHTDDTGETILSLQVSDNGTMITPDGIKFLGKIHKVNSNTCKKLIISGAEVITDNVLDDDMTETIEEIVIKEGCRIILDNAFANCISLNKVTLPSSLEYIFDSAFTDCTFSSIEMKDGIKAIGWQAFCRCDFLTEIRLPDSVEHLGANAFCECRRLNNLILSNRIQKIEYETFEGCGITEVNIPQGVLEITEWAFSHNDKLVRVSISETVKNIGAEAFKGCENLEHVVIPSGVESIGKEAFEECIALEKLHLPSSLKRIEYGAFSGCDLVSVSIDEGLRYIGAAAFAECSSLESINIPKSVKKIDSRAFVGCRSLKEVEVPVSTTICSDTFPVWTKIIRV